MGYKLMSGAGQVDSLDAADASLTRLPIDLGAAFTSPLRVTVPTVEERAATVKVSRMRGSMPTRFGPAVVLPRRSMGVESIGSLGAIFGGSRKATLASKGATPAIRKAIRKAQDRARLAAQKGGVPFGMLNKLQQKQVIAQRAALKLKAARAEGEIGAAKRAGIPLGVEKAMITGEAQRPRVAFPMNATPSQPAIYNPNIVQQAPAANAIGQLLAKRGNLHYTMSRLQSQDPRRKEMAAQITAIDRQVAALQKQVAAAQAPTTNAIGQLLTKRGNLYYTMSRLQSQDPRRKEMAAQITAIDRQVAALQKSMA